jgi:uncharacterized protein (TIGR01777 family)
MKTVLITGGTGLIGSYFIKRFLNDYNFILISRNKNTTLFNNSNITLIDWSDFEKNNQDIIDRVDIVINLAGESIMKRLSKKNKTKIYNSRISCTQTLVNAINQSKNPPECLINASAIGYYKTQKFPLDEKCSAGDDFMSSVCQRWEEEAKKACIRNIQIRIGLVLDPNGGFLKTLLLPFKLFGGGHLGHGNQGCPWVHRDDVIFSIKYIIESKSLEGPVNIVAPEIHSLKSFCFHLGKQLKRPSWFHVPAWIIRLIFGELAPSFLNTPFIKPEKLDKNGYEFKYKDLKNALKELLA